MKKEKNWSFHAQFRSGVDGRRLGGYNVGMERPRILLHACCAPDALYVAGILAEEYAPSLYFCNPNIHPEEEHDLRLRETEKAARILGIPIFVEPPDAARWFDLTRAFRNEPEKGRRCDICYAVRIQKTAQKASELGIPVFTTVMSLSPWKKAAVINRIGRMFAARHGLMFLEADFKKKSGFHHSVALSREKGIYRQNYCGCLFSLEAARRRGAGGAPA